MVGINKSAARLYVSFILMILLRSQYLCCCSRLLGDGAFGEVYLAKWRHLDVAVKCLKTGVLPAALPPAEGPDSLPGAIRAPANEAAAVKALKSTLEFLEEAFTVATLQHPNVISVWGVVLPSHLLLDEGVTSGRHQDHWQGESDSCVCLLCV
jgi:hypothetical protein